MRYASTTSVIYLCRITKTFYTTTLALISKLRARNYRLLTEDNTNGGGAFLYIVAQVSRSICGMTMILAVSFARGRELSIISFKQQPCSDPSDKELELPLRPNDYPRCSLRPQTGICAHCHGPEYRVTTVGPELADEVSCSSQGYDDEETLAKCVLKLPGKGWKRSCVDN